LYSKKIKEITMKKTLLLSVVASTMIMAGGDIAPVEPVVETPAVAVASGWDFSGQGVVYYQTHDRGDNDLFSQGSAADGTTGNSRANAGVQLRAVNKDLFAGVGAGVELTGLSTLGLQRDVVSGVMQKANNSALGRGGWISQAYLTYAMGNTSMKLGRQTLPKSLSPFAFSEGWNVFKNTFDAALVVNTDITDTTLVGAWVHSANGNGVAADMSDYAHLNDNDGVYMLTAQNKSVEGLTLTGTWYYLNDYLDGAGTDNMNILWGDAKFAISDYSIALQGGTILGADDAGLGEDTTAYGAKVGADFGMFDASVAYSSVDEGAVPIVNRGTLVKTPLYTQMILNQGVISTDADYIKAGVTAKALGGKFIANYGYAINNEDTIEGGADNNPAELDLIYKTKILNGSTTLLAAYVMIDPDKKGLDNNNVIRVWGRYNF
jgi:hypothetical protein